MEFENYSRRIGNSAPKHGKFERFGARKVSAATVTVQASKVLNVSNLDFEVSGTKVSAMFNWIGSLGTAYAIFEGYSDAIEAMKHYGVSLVGRAMNIPLITSKVPNLFRKMEKRGCYKMEGIRIEPWEWNQEIEVVVEDVTKEIWKRCPH